MIELRTTSKSTLAYQPKLGFLEIAFGRSRREALAFRNALRDAAIVADIESGGTALRGVAVLVESSDLVRASEILASHAQNESASIDTAMDDDNEEFDEDDDFSGDDDYDRDDDDDDYFDDDDDSDDDDDDYANDDEE